MKLIGRRYELAQLEQAYFDRVLTLEDLIESCRLTTALIELYCVNREAKRRSEYRRGVGGRL